MWCCGVLPFVSGDVFPLSCLPFQSLLPHRRQSLSYCSLSFKAQNSSSTRIYIWLGLKYYEFLGISVPANINPINTNALVSTTSQLHSELLFSASQGSLGHQISQHYWLLARSKVQRSLRTGECDIFLKEGINNMFCILRVILQSFYTLKCTAPLQVFFLAENLYYTTGCHTLLQGGRIFCLFVCTYVL